MSPLIFAPMPLPHDISGWLTTAAVILIGLILERRGEPRSVLVLLALGFICGLIYGRGDAGGVVGAVVGAFVGLAAARLNTKKRF
jgi:membrane associated rhomboid family serine protease